MKDEKDRIVFIDQLKAVAMFMVIVGHLSTPSFINSFIYSFHMPLFFMLSGATVNIQNVLSINFVEYAKNSCKRYLVPYFWIQLCCLPLYFFRLAFLDTVDFSMIQTLKAMAICNARILQFPVSATWFMLTLLLARLIFAAIVKISNGNTLHILILAILCSLVSFTQKDIDYPWHYTVSFAAVLFMFLGNRMMAWYKNGGEEKIENLSILKILSFALFFLFTGLLCVLSNHGLSMNMNNFGHRDSLILYYAMAVLLSLALFMLVVRLPKLSFLSFVGRNTLLYMALQGELIKIAYQIFPLWQKNYAVSVVIAFALFIGIAPICVFVNKFFPYIVGRESFLSPIPNRICKVLCVSECSMTFYYVFLRRFNSAVFVWGGGTDV